MTPRFLLIALLLCLLVSAVLASSVRPPISRVKADMRTMAVAIESYFIDNNAYPISTASPEWGIANDVLTTPISYLTSEPVDTFKVQLRVPRSHPTLELIGRIAFIWVGVFSTVALFLWMITICRPSKGRLNFFLNSAVVTLFIVFVGAILLPPGGHEFYDYRILPNPQFEGQPHNLDYATNDVGHWVLRSVGSDGDRDMLDLTRFAEPGFIDFVYDPTNGTASDGDVFRSGLGQEWWVE